jgi:N-acetylmuramoyl-L-alanine amidase
MVKNSNGRLTAEIAKTATIILVSGLCVLGGSFRVAAAVPAVKSMYVDAQLREQKARAAMLADGSQTAALAKVHDAVTAYESIVKHYPVSGYSDNALWQAARLSLDAFAKYGLPADREAGVRILKKLSATYPTSKLVKLVPEQLAALEINGTAVAGHTGPAPQAAPPTAGHTGPASQAAPVEAGLQAGPSPASSKLATIKDIRRAVLPDAVRITIELDAEVPFHEERIPDPARVFVDLPGTRAAAPLVDQTLRFEGDADIVRQVRVGRHPNNTTRIVLDAAGVTSYSVYPLYSPYRLVIDCVRVSAAVTAERMTEKVLARPSAATIAPVPRQVPSLLLPARTMTNPWLRKYPGGSPRAAALLASVAVAPSIEAAANAAAPRATDLGPVAPLPAAVPVTPPAHNVNGGLSIARQLGLGVSRIVIDPGHGGHDPGAKGKGVTEAELVLDVALRLEKLLQKVPGVEVILTRRTDDFIPLPERTAIANREGADLFLSIHANASTNTQAHGIETYFLNFANNQSAAAVAARENAASTQAMGGLPDFVKAIAMNNKLDESRDLAVHVQRAMVEKQRSSNKALKDLGVKQAPFVVLIGANMPSVLAEMGFVTNLQEAKLLKANAYRQKIAESLFNAIRKYQTSLKNVSTVALQ